MKPGETRIPYALLQSTLRNILLRHGFASADSERLATVFAESTLDGVGSHGIDRFPQFVDMADRGIIKKENLPSLVSANGAFERWDGNAAPGILNAWHCMDRAIALARVNVIGAVAIRNTHHWMRGGTYGRQAADSGLIAICCSNTQPNMPPWGGKDSRTGNNPLVIAMPSPQGHIVLDMSMAQFSYGKMQALAARNEKLPFPGGWDDAGNLTDDPSVIFRNLRPLPIGYWKGSALSIMLDLLVTILSEGNSSFRIRKTQDEMGWRSSVAPGQKIMESGLSQMFIAIDAAQTGDSNLQQLLVAEIVENIHGAEPIDAGGRALVPGESTLARRNQNLANGVPVDSTIWRRIVEM